MVRPEQYTGDARFCKQFGGKYVKLPVAQVHLDCPQFSGEVKACVIDDPITDVVLGNVQGSNLNASGDFWRFQCKKVYLWRRQTCEH